MKILVFAASNSGKSINKKLAASAAGLAEGHEIDILDLNDYEMPIYSMDREEATGFPQLAKDFLAKLEQADALIISLAEHNGTYSAAYKNIFDWCTRINRDVYANKPILALATSPGPGGGARVLDVFVTGAPVFAGNVVASLSVPSFFDNFDMQTQTVSNDELNDKLKEGVVKLLKG